MAKPNVTTSAYERSHGKGPSGYGAWAFQPSTNSTAFANELYGDIEFFDGSYQEAKKLAQEHFDGEFLIAVLP